LRIPTGKKAIGIHLSVEFYEDSTEQSTTWYKGTVILYNRQVGYVVSFDVYGPEENEIIKSLKKTVETNEIKLLLLHLNLGTLNYIIIKIEINQMLL